jgi:hypothetical protein
MRISDVTPSRGRDRLLGPAAVLGFACFVLVLVAPPARPASRGLVASAGRSGTASNPLRYTLRLDLRIVPEIAGKRVATFRQALRVFGQPAVLAPKAGVAPSCRASWPKLGLAIEFSTRASTCAIADLGSWLTVTATSRRWHADSGLSVGDPEPKLHRLYPQARRLDFLGYGPTWELETGGPFCDGGPPLALGAVVRKSHITSLIVVHVPACG